MVDSSVWIEIVRGTSKGEKARSYLSSKEILTTVISITEVERVLARGGESKKAGLVREVMERCSIDISKEIAKRAAHLSLEKNLGMADAIIAAASEINECVLYTADRDFLKKGLSVVLLK
jgi:predicted nucleic acid-binding protein